MTDAALRLPAESTATLAPGFERGVHRFERFDSLDIRCKRGRRRMQHGKIVIARICGNLSEPKTTRRGVDQFAVFDQSRRLGEPGRIPERTDFAPRLIA